MAFALSGKTGDLSWSLSGGTLTVTGKGDMPDYTDAVMPPWYDSVSAVTRISVGEGVTSVGDLAFYGCGRATSVTLPTTVTAIGDRAFKNCASLTALRLPAGLTTIGEAAFESCEKLGSIRLPDSLTAIGSYAFYRCVGLTSVTIPAGVTDMGMVVFAYCSGLTGAEILCPLTKVPDWTFYKCTALTEVSLPDTVTVAGEYSFHECGKLAEIHYAGGSAEKLLESIRQDDTALAAGASVKADGGYTGGSSSTVDVAPDGSAASGTDTKVSDSGNAAIVDRSQTDFTFKTDEKEPSEEGEDAAGTKEPTDVDIRNKTTISATVENSEGWTEVAERIDEALGRGGEKGSTVEADVSIAGTEIKGDDLANIAGKDVTLEVSTGNGDKWRFDASAMDRDDVSGKTYDLGYTMERDDREELDSDASYKLKFGGTVDIPATVAVPLPGDRAGGYATLYEKKGGKYNELQTTVVDNDGNAWFSTDGLSARGDYYIAINARGADTANAIVPHTLYEQYGIEPEYTLTDAEGNYYVVGDRESSWGISKKQFGLYIGIGLGAVVLVVTIVMVSMNIVKKSRLKAAAEHGAAADDAVDEDALRLKVMQEMLAERKNGKKDT